MTNEEIEKWARGGAAQLADGREHVAASVESLAAVLATFGRILASQAYEEAAQIAVDHRENSVNGCGEGGCGDTIASEIRALKAPLEAAPADV